MVTGTDMDTYGGLAAAVFIVAMLLLVYTPLAIWWRTAVAAIIGITVAVVAYQARH